MGFLPRKQHPVSLGSTVDRRVGFIVVASGKVTYIAKDRLNVKITYSDNGVYEVGKSYSVPRDEWTVVREDAW